MRRGSEVRSSDVSAAKFATQRKKTGRHPLRVGGIGRELAADRANGVLNLSRTGDALLGANPSRLLRAALKRQALLSRHAAHVAARRASGIDDDLPGPILPPPLDSPSV